jgi:hypothetical protein
MTLAKLDKEITKHDTVKPPPGAAPSYKQHISPSRVTLNSLTNDTALTSQQVSKYAAILLGSPLTFEPNQIDALSAEIDKFLEPNGTTLEGYARVWWRKGNAVRYGLEWYLRTQFEEAKAQEDVKMTDDGEDDTDDEPVTDLEILETFRAIGCISLSDFEIAVHRAVWNVEEKIEAFRVEVEAAIAGAATRAEAGLFLRNKRASYTNKNIETQAEPGQVGTEGEKKVYRWSAIKLEEAKVEDEKVDDPPVKKSLKVAVRPKKGKRSSK